MLPVDPQKCRPLLVLCPELQWIKYTWVPGPLLLSSVLLQETKHVFKIITKEDCLKVIPKLNCVFTVEIDGFVSYIYGSKFQVRSSERSAKKFKAKGTVDL
ncbi:Ribonuclease P protein subunit p29 [Vulpes lagopus]